MTGRAQVIEFAGFLDLGELFACRFNFEDSLESQAVHRHRRLLRACRKRPRRRRAFEQLDELATIHSITSSAVASSVGGISRPGAFAAFKLRTIWYLVGICTGRKARPYRIEFLGGPEPGIATAPARRRARRATTEDISL
jgi:hypothetical protein